MKRDRVEGGGEALAIMLAAAAIYLAGFVAVVRGLMRGVPKIYGDARTIAAFVRGKRKRSEH